MVAELGGCLDTLARLQRRVLVLRAGVGAVRPHSRRAVARRLDTSVRRVARVEHRGVRALRRSAGAGRCGEPVTTTAAALSSGGAPTAPAESTLVANREPDAAAAPPPTSAVQDEFRTRRAPDAPDAPETAVIPIPADAGEPILLLLAAAFLTGFASMYARERRRFRPSRRDPL